MPVASQKYLDSKPLFSVIHWNRKRREFFFSTVHGQPDTPDGFIPFTFYLPFQVVARPSIPDGVVATPQQAIDCFFWEVGQEIPNPNPAYQVQ